MKKSLTVICLLSLLFCGCSANASEETGKTKLQVKNKKYEICDRKVKVQELYFNDEKGFQCSDDNPYWDEILMQVERISGKDEIEPTEFEHDPELTVVTSGDISFELSDGVTAYAYPDVVGVEYENRDRSSYYIRILKKGKQKSIFYYGYGFLKWS